MRLDKPIDTFGRFWLPEENEEDSVFGRLTIEDGGNIELKLYLSAGSNIKKKFKDNEKIQIIGVVELNFSVTLDGCFIIKSNDFTPIGDNIILNVDIVFFDKEKFYNSPYLITEMRFQIEGLNDWLNYESFGLNKNLNAEPYSMSWGKPQTISLGTYEDARIELILKVDYCFNKINSQIKKVPFLKISTAKPVELVTFIKIAYNLVLFFSFVCNNITSICNSVIYDSKNTNKGTQIYYSSIPFLEKTPQFRINNMLFLYGHVKDKIIDLIEIWFTLCNNINPALSLFLSTKTNRNGFSESNFLALVQGLENFAKYSIPDTEEEKENFKNFRDYVLCRFKDEDDVRELLKRKLGAVSSKSFKERLTEFLKDLKELKYDGKKLWESEEFDGFIKTIVNNRNRYTHPGKSITDLAQSGNALYWFTLKVESLFQLVILSKLGFSIKEIEHIIANNYKLRQILEYKNPQSN